MLNPYNFFIVNVFHHTPRKKSRRLESPGRFKASASVSEAATSRLGLVSVLAQRVSCTSLLYSPEDSDQNYLRDTGLKQRSAVSRKREMLWCQA